MQPFPASLEVGWWLMSWMTFGIVASHAEDTASMQEGWGLLQT